MNTGGGHGILKSSLGVSAATLLSRVLGLVRDCKKFKMQRLL